MLWLVHYNANDNGKGWIGHSAKNMLKFAVAVDTKVSSCENGQRQLQSILLYIYMLTLTLIWYIQIPTLTP